MKQQDSQPADAAPRLRALGGAASLRTIAAALAILAGACGATAQRGATTSPAESTAQPSALAELPFSLCRAYGTAGTPCYPTTADRAGRALPPCRDAHRGRCEIRSGKGVCLLAPLPEGTSCTVGSGRGQCREGGCRSNDQSNDQSSDPRSE